MIQRFRSKALALAFEGNASKLTPNVRQRVVQVLDALDAARSLSDLQGLTNFHALRGDREGSYAVNITRNWRITFSLAPEETENLINDEKEVVFHVTRVDYEDYH